jgi:hypothetical protein
MVYWFRTIGEEAIWRSSSAFLILAAAIAW